MTATFKSLALAAIGATLGIGSIAPAGAATNQAVLTVNATVTNNCDVLTQPATLTMSYDPLTNVATLGTSSFTYACTSGASVAVTPASTNVVTAPKLGDDKWCQHPPVYALEQLDLHDRSVDERHKRVPKRRHWRIADVQHLRDPESRATDLAGWDIHRHSHVHI